VTAEVEDDGWVTAYVTRAPSRRQPTLREVSMAFERAYAEGAVIEFNPLGLKDWRLNWSPGK
jgi:hypothetical protein